MKNHSIQYSIQKQNQNIHSKNLFIQNLNQIIHSKNLFIQKQNQIIHSKNYSFKLDKTTQLEKTVRNRQKGPVLTSKGAFYSFFLWITHFFYSFNNSFNRTAKIFIQRIYSFKKDPKLSIQRIHSFKKDPKLFIQRIYSFKKIQNYSFKENIHSSEKWIIAQGYWVIKAGPYEGVAVYCTVSCTMHCAPWLNKRGIEQCWTVLLATPS